MTDPDNLPLAGVTVVSLEQAVAGPIATRHLADLGARVIKVERPGEGDFARRYDDAVHGLATHFVWLNRGKESLAVELKSEHGLRAVRALISRADVFLHNTAPGVVDRLGLDGETLRADDPRLVVVNISGYGTSGPRTNRKAYDMLVQAASGMVAVTGTPETQTKAGVPNADIAAGLYATTSVLSALFRRERTGQGAVVDVSMFDSAVEWMGHPLYMQLYGRWTTADLDDRLADVRPHEGRARAVRRRPDTPCAGTVRCLSSREYPLPGQGGDRGRGRAARHGRLLRGVAEPQRRDEEEDSAEGGVEEPGAGDHGEVSLPRAAGAHISPRARSTASTMPW
ncbi:MAG: CoA transferase [Pseudonocardia sp.]|nr:CoA transferase [Pseudonocardia sp.]